MPKRLSPPPSLPPELREQAEALLIHSSPVEASPRSAEALLHELQVHQIELEMQNEALREAQVELEASRDRYVDLYEFAPVGYVTLSPEGLIEQLNLAGARLLGKERGKLIRRRFAHFIVPEDKARWYRHLLQVMGQADKLGCEIDLRCHSGEVLHVQADCQRVTCDESVASVRIALSDVTQRRRAEQQECGAREAAEQASRAKSTFLASMSHEIRTPLHIIVGLGHLLRRDLTDPVDLQRLDQLCATSDHLLSILNDVLDLSKIEAGALEIDRSDFGLEMVVHRVVRMFQGAAHEKGLGLALDLAPRLQGLRLKGDALRLAQVLINLCGNAVKFTDQGAIHLGVNCLEEDAESVRLCFAVEDSGIGMSPAELAELFAPFVQADASSTRERGGTGLGLAISQRLVALMGGTIRVESQPGTGSRFVFDLRLPRAATAEEVAPPTSPAGRCCSPRTIPSARISSSKCSRTWAATWTWQATVWRRWNAPRPGTTI